MGKPGEERSEPNLEGGLGDANLRSSIQIGVRGKSTLRCTYP